MEHNDQPHRRRGTVSDEEFSAFVRIAWPRLRRTAWLICGNRQQAEDAVQAGLVRLYVAWPRLRREEALEAYARKAVVSALLDETRRGWRKREHPVGVLPDTLTVDDETPGRVGDRLAVASALARVPPRQRAVLVLRFYDDLDVAATARLLECSEGTVKSQTARGLEALRRALHAEGWDDMRLRGLVSAAAAEGVA
ncbi:SigE family RNA polymerase sigma factor [Yinghuangia seranimata]|uniref:SigE family RNA polymerase sigma factor n=1 Tax=Yinghuangia seranimata TaxID=408067 RepID=UPI00248CAD35|nr:SigE family RNA polymerase sigma factor [Yinghuangia seranimata]MDI2124556.1 SigE family RNA polymerase sigma factor [Yinghuangia seranimata]